MEKQLDIPFKKFTTLRPQQEEIINTTLGCDKKYLMLNCPTGSGKSLQNMMIAHNTSQKSLYICSSKMLQNQLHNDFPEAKILKGRGNYQCNLHRSLSADSCIEKCHPYKKKLKCRNCNSSCEYCEFDKHMMIDCNYYDTKFDVLKSKYAILNTHYYLNELNYSGSFKNYKTVIIDEADTLEGVLTDFISFSIHPNLLKKYNLQEPEYVTKLESWLEWAKQSKEKIDKIHRQYLWVLKIKDEERKEYEKDIKEFNCIQGLQTKINILTESLDAGWLFDHKDKFVFSPIWLTNSLAEKYLWQHGQRFVLSSATLHQKPIMAKLLGLNISDIDYLETDCPFPVENRRIVYKPVVALKKKSDNYEEDENKIIDEIVKTIDAHKGQKGLINAVSYRLTQKITKAHRRCITHNCNDKDVKLSDFYNSEDLVFVSPSSEHGLDLRDDLARFNIWAKVPFPNTTDKRISARLFGSGRFGQEWYSSVTAKKFEQGVGRTTRSMDDFSTSYIFDSQFDRIIPYLSKSVKEAIETKW